MDSGHNRSELTQLELQKDTQADPYILFEYSIRSPYTKESYFRRLRRFFNAISLEGPTFESRCMDIIKKHHNYDRIQDILFYGKFSASNMGTAFRNNQYTFD